jgi:hypothetical protein
MKIRITDVKRNHHWRVQLDASEVSDRLPISRMIVAVQWIDLAVREFTRGWRDFASAGLTHSIQMACSRQIGLKGLASFASNFLPVFPSSFTQLLLQVHSSPHQCSRGIAELLCFSPPTEALRRFPSVTARDPSDASSPMAAPSLSSQSPRSSQTFRSFRRVL